MTKGEGHQVTLKVEAGPADLEQILEAAYRDLGQKLKVPGFRKGKVPRKVIDSHVGADNVRKDAIKNGMPTLYLMGVRDSGILPVSDPEINVLEVGDDGSVVFEAKVDVKPEVKVGDYRGIEVEKPDTEVTDDDVQRALDEARDRFATLEVVEGRPVEDGDFVLFDYKVFTDGQPVEGTSGSDRMIEVGSEDFLPEFDEQLKGARKGDILDIFINFPPDYEVRELAGKPATYRTIVKEIKKKVLPEMNDDLARDISRFETLEEFKEDLNSRIARIKEANGERMVKENVIDSLVQKTYIDLPESMIEHRVQLEVDELAEELSGRGISLDEYLEAMKGTRHQLENGIRDRVIDNLKAELVIDAVATAEGVEITDEEAEEYVRKNAEAAGGDPDRMVKEARRQGRIPFVKSSLRISRAADFLAENAIIKGEEATAVVEEPAGEEADGPGATEATTAPVAAGDTGGAETGETSPQGGEPTEKEESEEG